MISAVSRAFAQAGVLTMAVLAMSGCVTTQAGPDGSTKVHLSLAEALGVKPATAPADRPGQPEITPTPPPASASPQAGSIRSTNLAALFTKHPYDGTPKTRFPRVAITVVDWSRTDCWTATAKLWWSPTKGEAVPAFSVCPGNSVGFAVNNAANLHLFMLQSAPKNTGNVRSNGPEAPMMAIPDRQPFGESRQLAFQQFIEQLIVETGWQPGASTNLWIVGYDNALKPTSLAPLGAPGDETFDGRAALTASSDWSSMGDAGLTCTLVTRAFT